MRTGMIVALGLGAALMSMGGVSAQAQDYPAKAVTAIVPYPPGASDSLLRFMQNSIQDDLKQPLVIENKVGANGYIGTQQVAKSPADGYTILYNITSSTVLGPLVSPDAGFDTMKDLVPITDIFVAPMVFAVRGNLPVSNFKEFVAYAKEHPGMNFGSSGVGGSAHLDLETMSHLAGIKLTHVPYRGFVAVVQALQGGELDAAFVITSLLRSSVESGKIKILAIEQNLSKVAPQYPELVTELPGFKSPLTYGHLFAPAGTPRAIVDKLNKAAVGALKRPDVAAKIEAGGDYLVLGHGVDETTQLLKQNIALTADLIAKAKADGAKFE